MGDSNGRLFWISDSGSVLKSRNMAHQVDYLEATNNRVYILDNRERELTIYSPGLFDLPR